jgi:hypothetical protein
MDNVERHLRDAVTSADRALDLYRRQEWERANAPRLRRERMEANYRELYWHLNELQVIESSPEIDHQIRRITCNMRVLVHRLGYTPST